MIRNDDIMKNMIIKSIDINYYNDGVCNAIVKYESKDGSIIRAQRLNNIYEVNEYKKAFAMQRNTIPDVLIEQGDIKEHYYRENYPMEYDFKSQESAPIDKVYFVPERNYGKKAPKSKTEKELEPSIGPGPIGTLDIVKSRNYFQRAPISNSLRPSGKTIKTKYGIIRMTSILLAFLIAGFSFSNEHFGNKRNRSVGSLPSIKIVETYDGKGNIIYNREIDEKFLEDFIKRYYSNEGYTSEELEHFLQITDKAYGENLYYLKDKEVRLDSSQPKNNGIIFHFSQYCKEGSIDYDILKKCEEIYNRYVCSYALHLSSSGIGIQDVCSKMFYTIINNDGFYKNESPEFKNLDPMTKRFIYKMFLNCLDAIELKYVSRSKADEPSRFSKMSSEYEFDDEKVIVDVLESNMKKCDEQLLESTKKR